MIRPWQKAIAPGAFVFVAEGLGWAVAAIGRSEAPVTIGGLVLFIGVVAAVLVPIGLVLTGEEDRWTWALVSLACSFLGIFFGFLFLLGAASAGCGGSCFD